VKGVDPRTLSEKDYDDMWGPGWSDVLWHWSQKTGWTRYERRREKIGDEPLTIEKGKAKR